MDFSTTEDRKHLIVGVGQAGLYIVDKFEKSYTANLKDIKGFFEPEFFYIDSHIGIADELGLLEDTRFIKIQGTDGGGGDREYMLPFSKKFSDSFKGYLSKRKLHDNTLITLVYSLGGTTGSTTGPLLQQQLTKDGYNVTSVVVGDESGSKEVKNNYRALMDLEDYASKDKVAYTVTYFKNSSHEEKDKKLTDISVNGYLTTMSAKLSDFNTDIDPKEMINLYNPNSTEERRGAPGIYKITFTRGIDEKREGEMCTAFAVLKLPNQEVDIYETGIKTIGSPVDDAVKKVFEVKGETLLPFYTSVFKDGFINIGKVLDNKFDKADEEEAQANVKKTSFKRR